MIIILLWTNCWDAEFLLCFSFPFLLNVLDHGQFFALFEASFPLLKTEWRMFESGGDVASVKEVHGVYRCWLYFYISLYFNISLLNIFSSCAFLLPWHLVLPNNWQFDTRMVLRDCKAFLDQLVDSDPRRLNANILICIFWRLIEYFISKAPKDLSLVGISIFCDLFFCFVFLIFLCVFVFLFLKFENCPAVCYFWLCSWILKTPALCYFWLCSWILFCFLFTPEYVNFFSVAGWRKMDMHTSESICLLCWVWSKACF